VNLNPLRNNLCCIHGEQESRSSFVRTFLKETVWSPKHRELRHQELSCDNNRVNLLKSLGDLIPFDVIPKSLGIFDFRTPAPQRAKNLKWAAKLGEQSGASLTGRVIDE
jgi:hypothetical protein